MARRVALFLLLSVWIVSPAFAQSLGGRAAAQALSATHIGGLTPLMTPSMIRRTLNGAQLGVRYGLREESATRIHTVAGSAIFAVGLQSSVALTAGTSDAECANCSPAIVLGLGGDMRVFERGDFLVGGSNFTLAVNGDFGYAKQSIVDNQSVIALGVGAPMTLVFGADRQGMRVVTFFTPVFGVGQMNDLVCFGGPPCDDTESGTRILLGGGVGIWSPLSSISASIGVNQVMIDQARPVFGVSVVVGGR
jgi:hypothetical protein